MSKRIDMVGNTYGRVTVVSYVGVSEDRHALWKCNCECGRTFITRGKDLRQGKITSCGCARKEHCSERMKLLNTTHGKRYTRLYHMLTRNLTSFYTPSTVFFRMPSAIRANFLIR